VIAFIRFLIYCGLVAVVTSLLLAGATGLYRGVPLAFQESLPGDDLQPLRQLPRAQLLAGVAGFMLGGLGGVAAAAGGRRLHPAFTTAAIGSVAVLTAKWTQATLLLDPQAGWLAYLESYRLILLAAIGSTLALTMAGWFLKPWVRGRRRATDRP
jgi:hypothetical protein